MGFHIVHSFQPGFLTNPSEHIISLVKLQHFAAASSKHHPLQYSLDTIWSRANSFASSQPLPDQTCGRVTHCSLRARHIRHGVSEITNVRASRLCLRPSPGVVVRVPRDLDHQSRRMVIVGPTNIVQHPAAAEGLPEVEDYLDPLSPVVVHGGENSVGQDSHRQIPLHVIMCPEPTWGFSERALSCLSNRLF